MSPSPHPARDVEIVECYKEHLSAMAVARVLRIDPKTVYKALRRSDVATTGLENYRKNAKRYSAEQEKTICDLYRSGASSKAIAAQIGGSPTTVIKTLSDLGVQRRKAPGRPADICEEKALKICRDYENGMSINTLAMRTGNSASTITTLLKRRMIKIRRQWGNPQKDRYVGSQGYIWVRIDKNDRFMAMCSSKGLVVEHRLVMARSLGRVLRPTETVHHINGIKSDNRLENLQLRQGNHGKNVAMCCHDCGSSNVGPIAISEA